MSSAKYSELKYSSAGFGIESTTTPEEPTENTTAQYSKAKLGLAQFSIDTTPEPPTPETNNLALFSYAKQSLAQFGIDTIPTPPVPSPFYMGDQLRGKVGRPEWEDPLGVYGIYQMRMTKQGKKPIKMKFYTPTNPRTPAQQANRQKFADAVSEWQSLTETEKKAYNERAKDLQLFGWNLFIREYYQSH